MLTYVYPKRTLPNFGIDCLSIDEAAGLLARCYLDRKNEMEWFDKNGYENCGDLEKEQISIWNPKFDELLKDEIAKFRSVLNSAIEQGKLIPEIIRRELDESVVSSETYIKNEDFKKWARERSICLGEPYEDYVYFQNNLSFKVSKYIEAEYAKMNHPAIEEECDRWDRNDLLLKLGELHNLKIELSKQAPRKEGSLSNRERETLLKLIIGMAVDAYGYSPKSTRSPLARELSEILTRQGLSVSDDTIRKWLQEASQLWPNEEECPR